MKRMLFLTCVVGWCLNAAAATLLPLSPAQLKQMQVQWGGLQVAHSGLSNRYPAEVVVPPTQTRVVAAPQAGLITALQVSVGDRVERGQVIGQLSSPDWVSLQSSFLQADTLATLHAQALQRDQALFQDGMIAQRRMQETQSAYETSQALMHERKQMLKLAGMGEMQIQQLAQKRIMQNGMAIRAPITGLIMAQQQTVGARVDMAMPIFTIINPKPLWLIIQLPITAASTVAAGSIVKLPKWGLTAKVETVLRQLNPNNQTTQVRAVIVDGAERLSVGQIVDVAFVAPAAKNSFSIPRSALAWQGQQALVFVQQANGVSVTPVNVLLEQDQQVIIHAPLTGNEMIAVHGAAALKGHWLGMGGE